MNHDTHDEDANNAGVRHEADAQRGPAQRRDFDASALIAHIQTAAENQKALLARELHDELGGLLVGAVMDLAWAEQHLSAPAAELRQKLVRARQTLAAAIDLKRKLIEDLRPTLLDNVGLFAALRWHLQSTCNLGSMVCKISLPDEERRFLPHVPIALFRIVQEAFAIIVAQCHPATTDFTVTVTDDVLTVVFVSTLGTSDDTGNGGLEPHALSAVRHRTAALGGEFSYGTESEHGIRVCAAFPLKAMLASA
jgi:signal transduction histidine kinase